MKGKSAGRADVGMPQSPAISALTGSTTTTTSAIMSFVVWWTPVVREHGTTQQVFMMNDLLGQRGHRGRKASSSRF